MIESWLEGSLGSTVLYLKHFEILEVKVIEDTSLKPCRLGPCPVTCSAHGNWLAYKHKGRTLTPPGIPIGQLLMTSGYSLVPRPLSKALEREP